MRRFCACAPILAVLSTPSLAADFLPTPSDAPSWFVQTRFIGGVSSAPGSFGTLPPGASDGDQTSYQPQENFGASAGIGRDFSLWGIPFRAVLDGSLNFRHDTDVASVPSVTPVYKGNLQVFDIRLSLLADVLDFGWGRFYVGGGLGAARVRNEVEFENTPTSVVNSEWKASPSFEAGIAFTGFSRRVIPQIAYRFRWIGDTESDPFPDGSRVRFKDFNIHDFMFGFTIPLSVDRAAFAPVAFTGDTSAIASASAEAPWTGFYVGANAGWAKTSDFDVSELATPSGATFYNGTGSGYSVNGDGFVGGGEIGVDWQWGWLVAGLSGEVGLLDVDGSATDPASSGGDTRTSFSTDWYGGMSLRAGLAYKRLLAFGRVGALYTHAEAKTEDDCTTGACGVSTVDASEDDILFGWFLGGGVEYLLGPHWSVGGEYRYLHLNDDLQPDGDSSSFGPVAQEVNFNPIHTVRASIKFRW